VRSVRKASEGGDESLALEGATDQVDDMDREIGEVAERLVLDLATLSEGTSQVVAGVSDTFDGVGDFGNMDCSRFPSHEGQYRESVHKSSREIRKYFGYKMQPKS
jgi:hypothetical protein